MKVVSSLAMVRGAMTFEQLLIFLTTASESTVRVSTIMRTSPAPASSIMWLSMSSLDVVSASIWSGVAESSRWPSASSTILSKEERSTAERTSFSLRKRHSRKSTPSGRGEREYSPYQSLNSSSVWLSATVTDTPIDDISSIMNGSLGFAPTISRVPEKGMSGQCGEGPSRSVFAPAEGSKSDASCESSLRTITSVSPGSSSSGGGAIIISPLPSL